MTTRVLVADDQALVRAGLRGIVETDDDLQVVAEAATGREAVERAREHRPDVVLMDVRMPDGDGLEATRTIVSSLPSRVIVLTTFDIDDYVYAALGGGASGFLIKDTPPHELLHAIHVVASGDAMISPGVTRRLIATFAAQGNAPPIAGAERLALVTEREREVLTLVAHGLSNAEIADRLTITTGTTKTHVRSLLRKLAARDRIQLAILAHRAGIARRSPPG